MTSGLNYAPELDIKNVAIFGSADITAEDDIYLDAFAVSKELAGAGYKVVNGGGPGVMQAATLGAEEAGGETLTVTFAPENAPNFEEASDVNVADDTIVAGDYIERVGLLIKNSDAFVIFKGGTGTISEWAMVWLLAHIYHGRHKPFILYGDFWPEILAMVQKNFFIADVEMDVFEIVTQVDEVIPALQRLTAHKQELQGL